MTHFESDWAFIPLICVHANITSVLLRQTNGEGLRCKRLDEEMKKREELPVALPAIAGLLPVLLSALDWNAVPEMGRQVGVKEGRGRC